MAKLNAKQKLFCREYLIDLNATQAAIRAGYSEKSAYTIGSENLRKPQIQNFISELNEKRIEKTKIGPEYVLERHKEIDQLDILDIIKTDLSGFRPLNEWPKSWRTSINGLDVAEIFEYSDGEKELSGLIKKIKWPDKVRNLELLGKHVDIQAYRENVNNTGTIQNVMVVPGCTSIDEWEKQAQQQHSETLGG